MRPWKFLSVFLLLLSAACGSSAQSSPVTQPPAVQQPATVTSQPTPTDTLTPVPTATATITLTSLPTPAPILAIDPHTLGQMRLLWTMSAPGSGSGIAAVQCQSASCDMTTRIGAYAFSPDNSLLAVGVCKDTPTQDKSGGNGKLYACPAGGEVDLYPALTGGTHDRLAIEGFPHALAFDPSGKILAVGTSDGHIDLWDLASRQKLLTLQHPTKRFGVIYLAFSPDGTLLLSQGDGQVVAWDPAQGSNLKTMTGYGAMSFDPSGQHLVMSWYDGGVAAVIARIFDLTHLGQSKDVRPGFVQPNMFNTTIRSAFSPDGQKLVIVGANGAEWWDAQGTKMEGHTDVDKLLKSNQQAAFAAVGTFLPNGLVLTEQGLDLSLPGMPLPSFNMSGTPSCGFALWDPSMQGAYSITNPPGGCQAPTANGDQERAVVSPKGTLVAADDSAGNLRVWGVDAAAAPIEPACLGTCQ
jgi:WD40 repeat protein